MFETLTYTISKSLLQLFFINHQAKWFFPEPAAVNIERIIDLHHFIIFFLIIILILVLWLLFILIDTFVNFHSITKNKLYYTFAFDSEKDNSTLYNTAYINSINRFFIEHKNLESSWTLSPCFLLITISLPSFYVLYVNEEILSKNFILHLLSQQWYWCIDQGSIFPYWYNKLKKIFDIDSFLTNSYLLPEEYLNKKRGAIRLLETEEPLFLPLRTHIRLFIGSLDTLHAFSFNQSGLKIDAVPGRLNQLELYLKRAVIFLDNVVKFAESDMVLCR